MLPIHSLWQHRYLVLLHLQYLVLPVCSLQQQSTPHHTAIVWVPGTSSLMVLVPSSTFMLLGTTLASCTTYGRTTPASYLTAILATWYSLYNNWGKYPMAPTMVTLPCLIMMERLNLTLTFMAIGDPLCGCHIWPTTDRLYYSTEGLPHAQPYFSYLSDNGQTVLWC